MQLPYPENSQGSAHARSIYWEARHRDGVFFLEYLNKSVAQGGMELALPFMDRDLIALLMAIPGEVRNWQGVPRMLLRRALAGVLPAAIAQRRDKADYTHLVNANVMAEHHRMTEYLKDGMLAARCGYLEPREVNREFHRTEDLILGETCVTSKALSNILGLEIWLRVFWPRGC